MMATAPLVVRLPESATVVMVQVTEPLRMTARTRIDPKVVKDLVEAVECLPWNHAVLLQQAEQLEWLRTHSLERWCCRCCPLGALLPVCQACWWR